MKNQFTQRVRRTARLATAFCALGVIGCGAEPEGSAGDPERDAVEVEGDVAEQEQGLFQQTTAQSNAQIFSWSKGQVDQALQPYSSHLCFLTRLSGEMGGAGSYLLTHHSNANASAGLGGVVLPSDGQGHITEDGGTWKLGGASNASNSLSGEATCVPRTNFQLGQGMVVWDSGSTATFGIPGNSAMQKGLWLGNAVSHIHGVQGWFQGGGEFAEIVPAAWNQTTQVSARSQNSKVVTAYARSMFVGVPSTPGTRRTAEASSSGNQKQFLMRTRDGVCFLTRISGDFNGSEERIRISPAIDSQGTEWWQLETHAGGGGSAYARAQCAFYRQS